MTAFWCWNQAWLTGRSKRAAKVRVGSGCVLRASVHHAGNNPKEGASALRELAQFLFFAEDLTDYDAGTTVNLTVAKGGVTSNVIAEEASATLDVRAAKLSEAERVEEALKSYATA